MKKILILSITAFLLCGFTQDDFDAAPTAEVTPEASVTPDDYPTPEVAPLPADENSPSDYPPPDDQPYNQDDMGEGEGEEDPYSY